MEIKIIDQGKDFVKIELIGETHTFANALKNEASNNPHVVVAGYTYEHPLVDNPIIMVKTDGKKDPKKILSDVINEIKKKNSEFLLKIKKL